MPATSAPNGKYVATTASPTAISLYGQSTVRPAVEIQTITHRSKTSERIDPARLYTYYSRETGQHEIDATIGLVSQRVGNALEHLRRAVAEPDELQRENHVSLALAAFFEVAVYVGFSPTFDEVFSLLSVSIAAHRSSPYSSRDLGTLLLALDIVRQTPSPSEENVDVIYELLIDAGFDVNAPFAELELRDEDGCEE